MTLPLLLSVAHWFQPPYITCCLCISPSNADSGPDNQFQLRWCQLNQQNSVTTVKSAAIKDTFCEDEQSRSSAASRGVQTEVHAGSMSWGVLISSRNKSLGEWKFYKSKVWISPFISGRQAFKMLVTDGIVTKLSVMIKVSNDFYVILHRLSSYLPPSCQNKRPAFPRSTQMPQCFSNKVIWTHATLLSAREKLAPEHVWVYSVELLATVNNSSRKPWMACSVSSGPLNNCQGFLPLPSLAVFYVDWQEEITSFTFSHSLNRNEW